MARINIKKLSPETQQEIKETQARIKATRKNLRYEASINKKALVKSQFKDYRKIWKVVHSNKTILSITEFENLLNESSLVLHSNVDLNLVLEDKLMGNKYYFDNIELAPRRKYNLMRYLQNELQAFPNIGDIGRLFMTMNEQYGQEQQLLADADHLAEMQEAILEGSLT